MSLFRSPRGAASEASGSPFGDDRTSRTWTVPVSNRFTGRFRGPPSPPPPSPFKVWMARLRRAARLAAMVGAGLALVWLGLLVAYRYTNPPTTTLILGQRLLGADIDRRWVNLGQMSPHIVRAVIVSEDGQFCRHRGVDWRELQTALDRNKDGAARGGSTISMQVTKNLFLWPSKSYVRKALEIPMTLAMEALWPKARVMEVYLNIAEWGPGVFGVEAASRIHFNKPSARLTEREAALLAVSLPNPFDREAGDPGPGTQRLADRLLARMKSSEIKTACVLSPPAPRNARLDR